MSYHASVALQGAVYQCLRDDPALSALVGDAVFDAMPIDPPSGVYLSLGAETMRGIHDSAGSVARHDFVVSVLAGTEEGAGFRAVKEAAAAACAALEGAQMDMGQSKLAGLWLVKSRAKRVENGAERRVDLTFRAVIDLN